MSCKLAPFRSPQMEPLEPRLLLAASAVDLEPIGCFGGLPEGASYAEPGPLGEPGEPVGDWAGYPPENTFVLHSAPGATKVIYLDFAGHTTTGTTWNTSYGEPIVTPPFSMDSSDAFDQVELERIQRIWERVAEDYLPFNVDVTTEDPGTEALRKSGGGDSHWGVRVAIGGDSDDWYDHLAGGIAYVGSFDRSADEPVFVFSEVFANSEKRIAEVASHEAGHALGLSHDGTSSDEYYRGHGSDATGWAPIMGVSYYQELTQWSKGEYLDANRTQDDLAIIVSGNGFGYRTDDHGSDAHNATLLTADGQNAVFAEGIIERNTDSDFFEFTVPNADIALTIDPLEFGANLDILATLYDSTGQVVGSSNPADELNAAFTLRLPSGTYRLAIEGVGKGTPADGYTDYGSLGYYSLSGTLIPLGPAVVVSRHMFHNNSLLDGFNPSANSWDDSAITFGVSALLPGQTGASGHVSGYSRGINGIIVDINVIIDTIEELTGDDFEFAVGNTPDPAGWTSAPDPLSITVRPGDGTGGSDRVTIIWADNAIRNEWLEVTVKATDETHLVTDDVFYFANLPSDATRDGIVDLDDFMVLKVFYGQFAPSPDVANFNLDVNVDLDDFSILKLGLGTTVCDVAPPAPAPASIDLFALVDTTRVTDAAPTIVAPTPSGRLHRNRRPASRPRTPHRLPASWPAPTYDLLTQTHLLTARQRT